MSFHDVSLERNRGLLLGQLQWRIKVSSRLFREAQTKIFQNDSRKPLLLCRSPIQHDRYVVHGLPFEPDGHFLLARPEHLASLRNEMPETDLQSEVDQLRCGVETQILGKRGFTRVQAGVRQMISHNRHRHSNLRTQENDTAAHHPAIRTPDGV